MNSGRLHEHGLSCLLLAVRTIEPGHAHGAEFELGDFAVWIERIDREQIGGGFFDMEGEKDVAA
jgi:hypothetical protein